MRSRALPKLPAAWYRRLRFCTTGLVLLFLTISAAVGWAVIAGGHFQAAGQDPRQSRGIFDYVSFHAAARMVREGDGARIYDLTEIGKVETETVGTPITAESVLPFLNPPFVAVAFAPLGGLPLDQFATALLVLNLGLFSATAVAVQKALRLTDRRGVLFFWLFCLSLFSVFALFQQKQLTLWICLAWLGFVAFEVNGKQRLAGAALALGLVKPQLVLLPLLFLVYRRQWRALASFSAIAVPLVIVSLVVIGPGGLIDYPRFLLDSTAWEANGVNARQMFGWNGIVADLTGDASPPRLVLLALAVPTLAVVAWSWRLAGEPRRLPAVMALTLTGSLLVNPHLYLYDMTLAGLALALGAVAAVQSGRSLAGWPAAAMLYWLAQLPLPGADYNHGVPLVSLSTVAMFVILLWSLKTPSRESVTAALPAQRSGLAA